MSITKPRTQAVRGFVMLTGRPPMMTLTDARGEVVATVLQVAGGGRMERDLLLGHED
ncbi:hypothetical protein [Streptomyces sp. 8N616]|uniref:hypothetical protein n=1 Tax=Streptomyces sp. 8N616 TaxID=3457414 RepID=UPI003FD278A3